MDAADVAGRPAVDADRAAHLARTLFGVEGPVRELGSHQDRNFLVASPAGPRVLKVANKAWGRAALEAQDAALEHVAHAGFAAPHPCPALAGGTLVEADVDGEPLLVRLLTYVEGEPLAEARYLAPVVVADLGRLAGRTAAALADFDHPGLDRELQWDLRRAGDVVASLVGSVRAGRREAVEAGTAAALERLASVRDALRVQPVHGDVTDDNVVGERDDAGRVRPAGVIDFGDLARSWLVAELAVACASVLRHRPEAPLAVLDAVRAFHAVAPLDDADVAALWPLVVLRGATLVVSGEHQAALDPDNPSATGPLESEWSIFEVASAVPFDLAEAAVRDALGLAPAPRHDAARAALAAAGPLLPDVGFVAALDLSTTSDSLHAGHFLDAGAEDHLLASAAALAGCAGTRWGEARLTRTVPLSAEEPATVALGVDLAVPEGTRVTAPWDVTVASADGDAVVVDGPAGRLTVTGVTGAPEAGTAVAQGDPLGTTAARVHVQVCLEPGLAAPAFATASTRGAWTALCPDPSPMLPGDLTARGGDPAALLARREAAFARVQEHYYAAPMQVERGWKHLLLDTDGRAYVDMVNNVAAVGHGHPELADAVERQMRLLNTNSRFHYAAVAELSERLAALAPDGLDTVFLVNSGSEAVDLALRIVRAVTGRDDVVAVQEAYHGVTMASDAVTTSLYDNPTALGSRPDWVHLVPAPNSYRGTFRGDDAGPRYAETVRETVEAMVAEGRPPAAFLCEPLFGNAGGVVLPEGYLPAVYETVRAAGGLAIADEVQVGYGRTGHHWWAFEMHGVTPDVITIAKAMGNGQPLGAVITRREVAEAFAAQGSFFSSAGGSPVSCVAGLTVLDIIEREGLQANAARVGDHLVERLRALADRFPVVGAVHGLGLYLGVELVTDRRTLEPATAQCYAVCDRLRDLGVVVQPTGERANVLKIKPPMCLTLEAADFVIDQLERVLTEGW